MPPTFRIARPDDVPALVALIRSAYRGDESRLGWTTEADLVDGQRTDAAEVAAVVESPTSLMLVAEVTGEVVGCCQLESRAGGSAYFGMFAVRPALQGAGIGRALLTHAESVARERYGASVLRMLVLRPRPELIAWYERLGYRRTGETVPWPYEDQSERPLRADLEFLALEKSLAQPV